MVELSQPFPSSSRKVSPVSQLIDAIYNNDRNKCCEILSEITVRQVNHLVRLKHQGYLGYTVTPLTWAVMNGYYDIVEILLSHKAQVNKTGTYNDETTLHTTSPLLEAVKMLDCKIACLLMEKGASPQREIPGPRLMEEEGGSLQYKEFLIPINVSLGKNIDLYKCLLEHSDMSLEYGSSKHTCLCYALEYFVDTSPLLLPYVEEVLHHGGKLCTGFKENSMATGNGICCHLKALIFKLVHPETVLGCGNVNHKLYYNCFKLVCSTDYLHQQSTVLKTLQDFLKTHRHFQMLHGDVIKDCLTWIVRYTESPSSLRHICRVTIRNCVRPFNLKQCEKLGLPQELLKYTMLDKCEPLF